MTIVGAENFGEGTPGTVEAQLRRRRAMRRVAAMAVLAAAALVGLLQLLGGLDGPRVGPAAPSGEPAPTDASPDEPEVGELDLDIEVPVRLLAVRFNNPSLTTVDLETGRVEHYPPGSHGLRADAISGALVASDGTIVVWQDDTVWVFPDRLDEPSLEHTPTEMINTAGTAPAMRVLPTTDGRGLWVIQIGDCCPDEVDGLAELVDLGTGQVQTTVVLPPSTFPAAHLGEDLLLNSVDHRPADPDDDAGWVTDPGSLRVLRLTVDGQLSELTDGHAIATSDNTVVIRTCPVDANAAGCALDLLDAATGERRPVAVAGGDSLDTAAGPTVPGDFTPWDVVGADGRILATITTRDTSSTEASSTRLVVLDPDTAELTEITSFDGPAPPAAWDRDGRYIVLADGRDLTIIDSTSGTTVTLDDVIPDDHHVVGVG